MATVAKFDNITNTQITVGATALNLADHIRSTGENAALLGADFWIIQIETNSVRLFTDGNTPTSALGISLIVDQTMVVARTPDLITFIRKGSSDAVINVQAGNNIANFL